MIFEMDYYTNIFKIKCNDFKLFNSLMVCNKTCFLYGYSGLYIVESSKGKKFIPLFIQNIEVDNAGDVLKVEAIPAGLTIEPKLIQNWLNSSNGDIKQLISNPDGRINIQGEDLDNFIWFKWDVMSYGAWFKFLPYLKQKQRLLNMINVESYSLIKKFDFKVADTEAVKTEMDIFFSANPWTFSSRIGSDTSNKINVLELKSSNSSIIDLYYSWEDIYSRMLGRRNNVDFKKERNISNEVEASQSNFDILEWEHKQYLELFLNEVKTKTGIECAIEEVQENEIQGMDERDNFNNN